jgi:hypothetical protein
VLSKNAGIKPVDKQEAYMSQEVLKLKDLNKEEVPMDLRAETYFDFRSYPFAHQALLDETNSVYGAILAIHDYSVKWLSDTIAEKRGSARVYKNKTPKPAYAIGNFEVILEEGAVFEPARIIGSRKDGECFSVYLEKGAEVIGSDIYLAGGSVYIGSGTKVEPGVGLKGSTIIGKDTEIRHGAYFRGDCIVGNGCTFRGELKNTIMMDKANFPHPSYVGDSVCGYMTHFGNQATAANLGIYEGLRDTDKRKPIIVQCDGKGYDLGKPKMGICMGDFSQVGCNSVADPATFLKPYTISYALTRITKGFYGPREVLKNKPLEHGVVERVSLNPL